jgi:hypothetical protein
MSTPNLTTAQNELAAVKRISFIKTIIIALLLISIGAFAYKYYSSKFTFDVSKLAKYKPMWSPEPTDEAQTNLDAYRDNMIYAKLAWYNKSKASGIVHDTTSMKDYIGFFKSFCEKHPAQSGYEWKVGYYPMVCKGPFGEDGDIRPRLSIYMIPTMVSKTDKKILDYWENRNSSCYPQPSTSVAPEQFIYNQGTIFP